MRGSGNTQGLSIMDRLDAVEAHLSTLQDDVASLGSLENELVALRPWKRESFLLRKHILEGSDQSPALERGGMDLAFQTKRYEIAHGGNVLLDCQVLAELREEPSGKKLSVSVWNFERMYGNQYDTMRELVSLAPPEVIELYNIRANVRIFDRWTIPVANDMKKQAQKIERDCSQSIKRWEEWIQGGRKWGAPDMEVAAKLARVMYDKGGL